MANLSDAFGEITIKKVGAEFLEFIKIAQGDSAYYTLIDEEDLQDVSPDEVGDITMSFMASGRWSYDNNIEGYLQGLWMMADSVRKEAYDKFIKALKDKEGSVRIEYTDSDSANDWMGTGYAELWVLNGEIEFTSSFNDEPITLQGYANLCGYADDEALGILYGDEVADKYSKYVHEWRKEHTFVLGVSEPASPGEWYDNEYKEE